MNKLRTVAVACGLVLLAVAGFGTSEYGAIAGATPFVMVAVLGIVVAILPDALTRVKHRLHRRNRERKGLDTRAGAKDQYYVADVSFLTRDRALDWVRSMLDDDPDFDCVADDEFPEGPGLAVRHGGFHGSFVRVTDGGRLVLSGASERTGDLAVALADALDTSFERTWSNPMRVSTPVKGGVRVALVFLVIAATLVGVGSVAAAGYPSSAYNPVEKAALASYDARALVEPGTTTTDAAIGKARFRIDSLEEADTEVRWSRNGSGQVLTSGRHAVTIAGDIRQALADLWRQDLTPAQRARVNAIAADLPSAEVAVADELDQRLDRGGVTHPAAGHRVESELRHHRAGAPAAGTPPLERPIRPFGQISLAARIQADV